MFFFLSVWNIEIYMHDIVKVELSNCGSNLSGWGRIILALGRDYRVGDRIILALGRIIGLGVELFPL